MYSRVKNKRIIKLKKDLSCEISLALQKRYANIIGPLETIPIDFAPMPNFECVILYFGQIPPPPPEKISSVS